MLKKIQKFEFILLGLILLLAFFLRSNNLYTWPREGATFDEYAWTWQGINIIQKGVPTSWSPHLIYENEKYIKYREAPFRLVTPYLEHPPVFGLVAGSFALLNGAKDMFDINLQTIRPLALILGIFSAFLVYILTKQLYDRNTALLSALLFATIPTIVVGSRILQNENFFIPAWLIALNLLIYYLKTKKAKYRNICAIICGLLILAKIPWIAASLSVVLIFLFLKKYKDVFKFLIITVPIALLFLVYGFYYDFDLFIKLWGFQLNRYDIEFNSLFALFQKPYLVDRFFTDGWIYFGWFAFTFLLIDFKKHYILILSLAAYFIIFIAGIPDEEGHGWYRYPFYPFLAISIALFIKNYFSKNPFLTFLFLVIVGTTLFHNVWTPIFGFSYFVLRLLIILWGLSLLTLLLPKKLIKFPIFSNYIWLGVFIVLNIFSILIYNEQ